MRESYYEKEHFFLVSSNTVGTVMGDAVGLVQLHQVGIKRGEMPDKALLAGEK